MTPRILVSSGELSGDQRLADILHALGVQVAGLEAAGIGPAPMVSPLAERGDVAMMGLERLPEVAARLWRVRRAILQAARSGCYSGAMVVDYSGFNIPLGRALRRRGLPVVYYVPPKLWAWGAWRAPKLRDAADVLVTTMPFEDQWFRDRGFTTVFAGHPAQDHFVHRPSRTVARAELGIDDAERVLLVMPGSRQGEIDRHVPVLQRALARRELARQVDRVLVPVAQPQFGAMLQSAFETCVVPVTWAQTASAREYCASDLAWIASGTANLEAAWCGLPAAVFYRTGGLTYALGRRLVQVTWLSPVNLWHQRVIYPEYVQDDLTDTALLTWLCDHNHAAVRTNLLANFSPRDAIVPQLAQRIRPWLKLP